NNAAAVNNDALRWAAERGRFEVVRELLKVEAVRNNAAAENNETLDYAIMHQQIEVIMDLLKIEAVRNNIAAKNNKTLQLAIQYGCLEIVSELLKIEAVRKHVMENPSNYSGDLYDMAIDSAAKAGAHAAKTITHAHALARAHCSNEAPPGLATQHIHARPGV